MRKFLIAGAFLALTPAFAQAHSGHGPYPARVESAHRDVVRDRREVREERRELRHARRELHRDHRRLHHARVARARAWHRHHRYHR